MELIIAAIEQVGIAAFSISGAITGIRKKMDLFGVILLGIVTAVGGRRPAGRHHRRDPAGGLSKSRLYGHCFLRCAGDLFPLCALPAQPQAAAL